MSTPQAYINSLTPPQKAEFQRIRAVVQQLAPDAEEVLSYGIVAFKRGKQYILWFGAFKHHMSLFPASDAMVADLGSQVAALRTSKGTLRFSETKPIPDALLKRIIEHRLKYPDSAA
jgi:uncharacterized protein YdhG (YjbR/CyaY superfamily)